MEHIRFTRAVLLATALLSAAVAPALAVPSTPDQAKALVQDAVAYLKAKGPAEAAKAFNDPKGGFVRQDLYVFVFDKTGHYVASGGNPKLTGQDAATLTDAEGKPIVQEMMKATAANPASVVEYVWLNRASNKVEHKHSYVVREGDYLVGSGYYTE
ncbi:cache domain-containing protein [Azospirillum doebereinerae]|uniref:cache domain-containing protein n=1 Tax=Azospirillum doebereinerae TaxID=92933 RepID=UPI001EE5F130|nr:cache domain-containing protein [Azospirillum doebereinerae]MCG5243593.1 cache domain-containing protein [Azospirillum doebereinerae]